jgi:hypothetical protein
MFATTTKQCSSRLVTFAWFERDLINALLQTGDFFPPDKVIVRSFPDLEHGLAAGPVVDLKPHLQFTDRLAL